MRREPVIVVSGQVAAGKTTLGEMLRARGLQYARVSQAIGRRWGSTEGGRPTRDWYREMGLKLHREVGQEVLCEETLRLVDDHEAGFVVEGARWHEDVAFFRRRFGPRMVHVHLTAPTDLRRQRFEGRESGGDFDEAEADEVESEVNALAGHADILFENSGETTDRLAALVDEIIGEEGSK
ncbi:AAA family ATPase [Erythrobacter sp. LQ02-29]|uniref:AAA family ATPase n=1 Tax=Erythrobacter sp. LQ02-29 TaxID=2920384 RepID=UPI00358F906D